MRARRPSLRPWPPQSLQCTAPRPNGEALPHRASLSRGALTKSLTPENASGLANKDAILQKLFHDLWGQATLLNGLAQPFLHLQERAVDGLELEVTKADPAVRDEQS